MNRQLHWNEDWTMGVDEMDKAHMSIADKLDRLFLICRDHQDHLTHRASLTRIAEKLFFELWDHLHEEEELMEETHYPHEKEHLSEHFRLINEFRCFLREVRSDREHFDMSVLRSLRGWFVRHLEGDDRDLSEHVLRYRQAQAGGDASTQPAMAAEARTAH